MTARISGRFARGVALATLTVALVLMLNAPRTLAQLSDGQDVIPAPASVEAVAPGATNVAQQAFDEAQGVLLPVDVSVDGGVVPAGTLVNSHMIFLKAPPGRRA